MSIEVLNRGKWQPHHGIVGTQTGSDGQITKCLIDGVLCYVRENFSKAGSFHMASNARMALKRGGTGGAKQVLELVATSGDWEKLAGTVAAADPLGRPVCRNRNFTQQWAEHELKGRGNHG